MYIIPGVVPLKFLGSNEMTPPLTKLVGANVTFTKLVDPVFNWEMVKLPSLNNVPGVIIYWSAAPLGAIFSLSKSP